MDTSPQKRLLKNKKVLEEISRHQWIESEKAGFDIGFEQASQDWLERFSKAWMAYHIPQKLSPTQPKKPATQKPKSPVLSNAKNKR